MILILLIKLLPATVDTLRVDLARLLLSTCGTNLCEIFSNLQKSFTFVQSSEAAIISADFEIVEDQDCTSRCDKLERFFLGCSFEAFRENGRLAKKTFASNLYD